MNSKILWIVLVLIVALLLPTLSYAQACDSGRIRSGPGCCWPGQRYNLRTRTCTGQPTCPPGMRSSTSNCVAVVYSTTDPSSPIDNRATPARVSRTEHPVALSDIPPDQDYRGGAVPTGMHVERGIRWGWLVFGSILFLGGYSIAIVQSTLYSIDIEYYDIGSGRTVTVQCGSMHASLVPVVGAAVMALAPPANGGVNCLGSGLTRQIRPEVAPFAASSTLLQLVGVPLIVYGLTSWARIVRDPNYRSVSGLRIEPWIAGEVVGGSIGGNF